MNSLTAGRALQRVCQLLTIDKEQLKLAFHLVALECLRTEGSIDLYWRFF
jgi:hypothetical protein